jgi:hypothetical protein
VLTGINFPIGPIPGQKKKRTRASNKEKAKCLALSKKVFATMAGI